MATVAVGATAVSVPFAALYSSFSSLNPSLRPLNRLAGSSAARQHGVSASHISHVFCDMSLQAPSTHHCCPSVPFLPPRYPDAPSPPILVYCIQFYCVSVNYAISVSVSPAPTVRTSGVYAYTCELPFKLQTPGGWAYLTKSRLPIDIATFANLLCPLAG